VKLEGKQLWRFFLQGIFGQQEEESFSPSFPFFPLKTCIEMRKWPAIKGKWG
jgi:hypothetical protein